ncbi:hypothetical protein E4J89_11150 [Arthrobacter sp. CAU 1506]|uniref:hypothetical protein n=1 Tax=Arthrobacter sp. CAU 1506 TaxID=2560052 RepID=UPI0010ABF177|nr:hypothetical protein [Arthrobacter sp. CAU 1506]TJY69470.1 hypothetical protein E4J89_11150 [Arthrobacter sp. CAU 1506]
MMSLEIQSAVSTLQQQSEVTRASLDTVELDRIDRALDELIRNHTKTSQPLRMVRSARANALKVVKDRARQGLVSFDDPDLYAAKRAEAEAASAYDPLAEFELLDWLDSTPSLTVHQRQLLKAVARGHDAESLACAAGLPVKRMRERISRARSAAFAGYIAEVTCA